MPPGETKPDHPSEQGSGRVVPASLADEVDEVGQTAKEQQHQKQQQQQPRRKYKPREKQKQKARKGEQLMQGAHSLVRR